MSDYTLYGAEVSYFTGKVRAYLRWRGVGFEERVATQEVYRDVILPHVGWPVIPVMAMPGGEVVQDTADIISRVEAAEGRSPPAWPEAPLQRFVAELLQLYADEWLVLPAMHYRWAYNEDWAYGAFGTLSAPHETREAQYEIGKRNGARFKGSLPVLGVSAATVPGIEASYEAFLAEFSAHLDVHPYLLGGHATIADFAFYGPLYAHLYRDPTSGEMMRSKAPSVADWVERMTDGAIGGGPLVGGGSVPRTLAPILERQMREQLPALAATVPLLVGWAMQTSAGERVPRALGDIEIDIEGHRGPAKARTFPLWRLQAAQHVYDAMDEGSRGRANVLLDTVGGAQLLKLRYPRLARENSRVVLG